MEEVAIHRGRLVTLLDQFNLQGARIGERNRDVHRRGRTLIPEVLNRGVLDVEPWSDAQHLDPVPHGRRDVTYDIAILGNGPEDTTHGLILLCSCIMLSGPFSYAGGISGVAGPPDSGSGRDRHASRPR